VVQSKCSLPVLSDFRCTLCCHISCDVHISALCLVEDEGKMLALCSKALRSMSRVSFSRCLHILPIFYESESSSLPIRSLIIASTPRGRSSSLPLHATVIGLYLQLNPIFASIRPSIDS
jgi:hypothetical protein